MPLEHSNVPELLVPYLRHDRERRAAHARALRQARLARGEGPAGHRALALASLLRFVPAALRRRRSPPGVGREPRDTTDGGRGPDVTTANRRRSRQEPARRVAAALEAELRRPAGASCA